MVDQSESKADKCVHSWEQRCEHCAPEPVQANTASGRLASARDYAASCDGMPNRGRRKTIEDAFMAGWDAGRVKDDEENKYLREVLRVISTPIPNSINTTEVESLMREAARVALKATGAE